MKCTGKEKRKKNRVRELQDTLNVIQVLNKKANKCEKEEANRCYHPK